MRADILPSLATAAGLDPQVAADAWGKARESALKANGGRDDSRTFALTVEAFRQKHPFDYSMLNTKPSASAPMAGSKAGDDTDPASSSKPL